MGYIYTRDLSATPKDIGLCKAIRDGQLSIHNSLYYLLSILEMYNIESGIFLHQLASLDFPSTRY